MPLYEFECTKCGTRVEILQAKYHNDKIDQNCPACKKCGGPTRRAFSVPLVLYSGDGFFTTDSKAKSSSEGSAPSESGSLVE